MSWGHPGALFLGTVASREAQEAVPKRRPPGVYGRDVVRLCMGTKVQWCCRSGHLAGWIGWH